MSSTPADLQALFASIKPRPYAGSPNHALASDNQQRQQHQQRQQQHGYPHHPQHPPPGFAAPQHYAPPYASSPLYSPPINSIPPPHHGSDIISPNVSTPRSEQAPPTATGGGDRTSQLLNLLKFSPPPPAEAGLPSGGSQRPEGTGENPNFGAGSRMPPSDLVASLFGKTSPEGSGAGVSAGQGPAGAAAPENAQDMLLRLLNRPRTQVVQSIETSPPGPSSDVDVRKAEVLEAQMAGNEATPLSRDSQGEERRDSPIRTFGSAESRENTPFEPPEPKTAKGPIFSYVNPFEALAAAPGSARPRKPARGSPPGEAQKSATPESASKVVINGAKPKEVAVEVETSTFTEHGRHTPGSAKRANVEAKDKETVPQALEGVAGKVDTEAEEALARATGKKIKSKHPEAEEEISQEVLEKLTEGLFSPTPEPQKGPSEVSNKAKTKQSEETKEHGKKETVADTWEAEADTERIVPVYNFPLKPFVSITWTGNNPTPVTIRDDGVMDIARLRKGFDQLDRSLTSATSEYIVYALAKNGGARIIRQDDGHDRQIFRSTNDRMFNVSVCQSQAGWSGAKDQTFLGIGVSGSVYWAAISRGNDDLFERDSIESESLIFPPFPMSDENTSGGQLKTRAKQSSRHPGMFAIGRGKSIHLVWPHKAASPHYGVTATERKVDIEKYFKECSLKIATGKAGKDFVFSDDDSVIVSLDKTGRMRFWNIHQVEIGVTAIPKPDLRTPMLTLVTGLPNAKSWPTSVIFIDKQRPYSKVQALRYILVGLKQNHTLQLWDLGLGKAIQELNFPHSNESDAICSVVYHPGSGFVVVGHPTRNSIYFIHLSAPRYSLPAMSQAAYIQSVADKDPNLPRTESTACMSGIREVSFGSKGQLRSLELLPLAKQSPQRGIEEEAGLFELYVMHSKGVTCLNIKKVDLGWSIDNKIVESVDALENGYIESKDLETLPLPTDEQTAPSETTHTTSKAAANDVSKKSEPSLTTPPRGESPKKKTPEAAVSAPEQPAVDKTEKKKKKKAAKEPAKQVEEATEIQIMTPPKPSTAPKETKEEPKNVQAATEAVPGSTAAKRVMDTGLQPNGDRLSLDALSQEILKIEKTLTSEFSKCLNGELDGVYRRFDEDRRAQDAASTSRQDAVLRLISSTLSDNVEKNLARIVAANIQSTVVPALHESTSSSLDKHVSGAISQQLSGALPQSIKAALPEAIAKAMQAPDTLNAMSKFIVPSVAGRIEQEFANTVRNTIIPTFKEEHARSAEKLTKEIEQRFVGKMKRLEAQQYKDSVKIDELTTLVRSMADSVNTIAAAQDGFGKEILNLHRQVASKEEPKQEPAPPVVEERAPPALSNEETELAEIAALMLDQKYEEASVRVRSSIPLDETTFPY